jgi:predicted DNA-binding transcriptional regulator YafY
VRVFAVHRFLAAALTDEHFAVRPETRSKAALRGAFRVWRDDHVSTVRVRFAPKVAPEIRERTWARGQRLEDAAGDGSIILTLEVTGFPEIERWIPGYGGDAEVLEPAELWRSVAAKARYAVDGDTERSRLGQRRPAVRASAGAGASSTPAEDSLSRDEKAEG